MKKRTVIMIAVIAVTAVVGAYIFMQIRAVNETDVQINVTYSVNEKEKSIMFITDVKNISKRQITLIAKVDDEEYHLLYNESPDEATIEANSAEEYYASYCYTDEAELDELIKRNYLFKIYPFVGSQPSVFSKEITVKCSEFKKADDMLEQ